MGLFYDETEGIKSTKEDQEKDIEDKTVVLDTAFKVYNTPLVICNFDLINLNPQKRER